MKTLLLAVASAAIAFSPTSASQLPDNGATSTQSDVKLTKAEKKAQKVAAEKAKNDPASDVIPNSTETNPAVTPVQPNDASLPNDALASLGSAATAAHDEKWSDLDDSHRYLLIMGTVDGYAAAGTNAPCFPGADNVGIDDKLKSNGFSDSDPADLAEAMTKLSASSEQCTGTQMRGYGNKLLKGMPDEHLSAYLTGAVRAYARVKSCPVQFQSYAAAAVTAAIFTGPDEAQPPVILASALAEGCKGPN